MKRFDQSMFQLQSADQIAQQISDELLESESIHLLNAMQMALSSVDICMALSVLLQQLSAGMSGGGRVKANDVHISNKSHFRLLFSGSLGLGALSESSRQMADLRFVFCISVSLI